MQCSDLDIQYSVDMIRFKVNIRRREYEDLLRVLNARDDPQFEMSVHSKIGRHRYEVVVKSEHENFWFGYDRNSDQTPGDDREFTLEYNPNKNDHKKYVLAQIFSYVNTLRAAGDPITWRIYGCDLAMDFHGIPFDYFLIHNGRYRSRKEYYGNALEKGYMTEEQAFRDLFRKRRIFEIIETGGRTTYLGKGDNRVKIYDKGQEQIANGHWKTLEHQWTRVEFTTVVGCELRFFRGINDLAFTIPDIFIDVSIPQDLTLNKQCMLYAIKSGFKTLGDFDKRNKKELKALLEASSSYVINDNVKPNLVNTLKSYLETLVTFHNIEVLPF